MSNRYASVEHDHESAAMQTNLARHSRISLRLKINGKTSRVRAISKIG
jgi:hypothetical protein